MVDGLNAVEIAVGGVAGAAFGSIFDGITEVLRNAAEFTTSHANIKSTLEALQPLIREIEGKNKRLLLQDEELKDLKKEIEAGVKRVQELSKKSVWNYCKRPLYNMKLDGMDKSLKRLLRILQVQGVRDVKEVLVQVNDCKTDVNKISIQLDDCKTGIVRYGEETLNLTKTVLDRFERINGPSGFVPISEKVASLVEEEALRSSLPTMRHAVDEALSKPNPHNNISRIEEALRRVVEELGDADKNRKLDMGVHEVKWFRIKVEEGTELIRKCSNVVEWTDRKMVKYANKLDDLGKLVMGQEIAVKRLSKCSGQGLSEFKNELILNELQHTNLVQLFGSCIHGKEMMGYMAPETFGRIISVKSDVYSFGVLMLEIISGRKMNSSYNDDRAHNLVGYAWELWKEGAGLELMDPTLGNSFIKEQLLRCIHVGLLCVEENAADRPTMSDVISMMINESLPLASPTKPAFCVGRRTVESQTGITLSQELEMESQTDINWSQQSANYKSSSDFEAH
ncbi:hypothetical protein C1H46_006865 [Malus baccata]|uniref:RPW8 domain-containing protein n=1 Tax=Malus baccata TaxID=106549 RepID=A0A540N949_MALBA|nr:hypothetical protein C1H46_006865 [Malus baccata]